MRGDRIQLQQVIINLVINGVEAMAAVSDRERVLIVRTQRHQPGHVLVSVEDADIGIEPNKANRLFRAFTRRSPMAWAWGFRSADRSSRHTADGCGLLPMPGQA